MAFIKVESEDMRIEETIRIKHEETEDQTKMLFIKEESEEMKIEETFSLKHEDPEEQTDIICPLSSRPARATPSNPWLSEVLREHRTELRAAERKWHKSKDASDLKIFEGKQPPRPCISREEGKCCDKKRVVPKKAKSLEENRAPGPALAERREKAASKKRMVPKKAASTLFREVMGHQRQTVSEDLRPELARRDAEINALKQQLRVCKARHVEEMEALRSELRVCKEAHVEAKASLADMQATHRGLIEIHSTVVTQLREAQTAVTEALRTRLNCTPAATSDCLTPTRGTPCRDADSSGSVPSSATAPITNSHPDLPFTSPTPELLESLMMQSRGRPDRYGCLLFRAVVPQQLYEEWASTTNWDGSRGKRGLPVNVRQFITNSVAQRFPRMASCDDKRIKDRVNEFLRSPRNTIAH
ncbi:hypothetical protein PO909_029540 [Leuciscus waleckii]